MIFTIYESKVEQNNSGASVPEVEYPILCLNIALILKHIAFALKHIGKLYPQQQHFVIVQNNHFAGQGLFLLVMDFFINNFLYIKSLPVVSYKRFKHEDAYMCHLPAPNVLPSFLCSLLAIHKRRLLIFINIYFHLMILITIY